MLKRKMNLQLFAMPNPDVLQQRRADIAVALNQAMKDGDEEAFQKAFSDYTDILQEAVMAEAKGLIQAADNQVLAGRGVRALTSQETSYYQKIIEAMKSDSPKQALSGFNEVLPKTVIDAIFEDITEAHPLLEAIKFENAAALIEYLYSTTDGRFLATWGQLCSTITTQLSASFAKLSLSQTKLSAFLPICKAMLDLGPAWLDRYVRTILYEAIANGLESGIVAGRGIAEGAAQAADKIYEPIGMVKNLDNYHLTNGYADKVAQPIADFSPDTYGGLVAQLAVSPNGLNRRIGEVLLVVNPVDYLTKVMPATTYLTPNGSYVNNVFPFPTKVVQSAYMPQGKAVIGIGKRYLMAMGAGTNGGKIEFSDEYKFLEDERYYLIKLYGTGRPLDNTSFLYLDISSLKPHYPVVRVADYVEAGLASIEVVDELENEIDLSFDPAIHYYEATVDDAKAANDNNQIVIKAAAAESEGVITATLNGDAVSDPNWVTGATLTLAAGANIIILTVTTANLVEQYVLVVNHTAIA